MKFLIIFALILLGSLPIFGQTDAIIMYEITTSDGNRFLGSIVAESDDEIQFLTYNYGEIIIKKYLISERKEVHPPKTKKEKKLEKQTIIIPDASNKDSVWRVVTNDGFDFVGTISAYETDGIKLKTEKFGEIKLLQSTIKRISLVQDEEIIDGDIWFENPQASRYFYSPNGYGLKKGEGYYQNVWVLFNQASYGFSDKFTMGVGTVPVFLFGADVVPFWITPKFSFPIVENKINISAGVFAGAILGNSTAFALPYATVTLGDRNKNLNLGGGFLAVNDASLSMFTASSMIRFNKKSYFLTENYFFIEDGEAILLLSAGGRTVWPRISIDYGLFVPFGTGSFFAVPWVGFVLPFGKE